MSVLDKVAAAPGPGPGATASRYTVTRSTLRGRFNLYDSRTGRTLYLLTRAEIKRWVSAAEIFALTTADTATTTSKRSDR